MAGPRIEVVGGDVRAVDVDVLVLKWAQGPHGADEAVALALREDSRALGLVPGEARAVQGAGRVGARTVLFLGAAPLTDLGYRELRSLATDLATAAAGTRASTVGLTLHGPGYGLDERECTRALLAGLLDASEALAAGGTDVVRLIEADPRRGDVVRALVADHVPGGVLAWDEVPAERRARLAEAGPGSSEQPVAQVAMAMNGGTEDVFRQGIEPVVHAAGLLCERQVPSGRDDLARTLARLDRATVVVADLTGGNPNVHLQLGYAWGRGIPTVVLVGAGEEARIVPFDGRAAADLAYRGIAGLRAGLPAVLARRTEGRA